jgi:hypothetical protein
MPSATAIQPKESGPFEEPVTCVDLNKVLQCALMKFRTAVKEYPVIIRCELLPETIGNNSQLAELFDKLFELILKNPSVGSKWYLHITCKEEAIEDGTTSKDGFRQFVIQFHTNIKTSKEWRTMAIMTVKDCEPVLMTHKWTLKISDMRNTGRLFSVSLPGKLT